MGLEARSQLSNLNSHISTPVRFLLVGTILGPVGVRGELRLGVITDFPERLAQHEIVHIGENLRPYRLEYTRIAGRDVIVKLEGVSDPDAALALRGATVEVPAAAAAPLEPDQYYWHQVIGLAVWTDEGRFLGTISEILRTGSNDVYVVERDGGEILLPAIEDVVKRIDVGTGRMDVHLLPGLE